jgi:hypothetical protein
MRIMLPSLIEILVAADRGDSTRMSDAARRSGMAAAADPALERRLPDAWLQMALATQGAFDRMAKAGGARVLSRLGPLTANAACHVRYRLEIGSPERPA